ncbi:MAG: ABC transporter ATP-binding protein [Acidobacteria bacterium]|nr:ABC transporter ATP-binding protein [Acidobacteriota bacterium]
MDAPLVLDNLWKSFGPVEAVRGLSLCVPAGSVYGFLGPNGAGKSTTIRMILGLQRPGRGAITVFGQSLATHGPTVLGRIGSLVESPSLYHHLTGRENLEIHRLLLNLPKRVVDEALDAVDLLRAANQTVRGYSSGMKQRLGLAQALLGDPELLLLDEPTNALDPAGIHEVRHLIRALPNRRRATVFLSSHLLAEVEQTATHVAIVAKGQVKFEGSAEELRARSRPWLTLEVDDPHRAAALLHGAGLAASQSGSRLRVNLDHQIGPAAINRLLVNAGIDVTQLTTGYPTLEETFLELTAPVAAEVEA